MNDYIKEANDKIAEWSSGCDQSISLGTLEEFVEIELQEVQRRYDQFGNLIDETIRNLKIKLKVTKDKEVKYKNGVMVVLSVILHILVGEICPVAIHLGCLRHMCRLGCGFT